MKVEIKLTGNELENVLMAWVVAKKPDLKPATVTFHIRETLRGPTDPRDPGSGVTAVTGATIHCEEKIDG